MSRALDVLTAICVSLSFASSICREPRLLNLSSGANPSTHTLCAAIVQCFFHVHCECAKVLCSALFTPYRLQLTKRRTHLGVDPEHPDFGNQSRYCRLLL